jgi:hypothetical protein
MKIDRKEQKYLEKDVSGFHYVNYKFHTICPERQHGPVR